MFRVAVALLLAAARQFPLVTLRFARRWMPDRRVVDDADFTAYFLDGRRGMTRRPEATTIVITP